MGAIFKEDNMEEKKLTDEELVKALECCVKNDCEKCPYLIKGFDCVISKQAENDVIDLIHRLQSENERLSLIASVLDKGVAVEIVNIQETIDTQKAEIERLTEENERVRERKNEVLHRNLELKKQVKILTEENEELHNDNTTLIAGSILQKEQVEKDTAKDIIKMLRRRSYRSIESHIMYLSKKYGVEVE